MIDLGIAVVGGILYLAGLYGLALSLIILSIISGAGAVLMALKGARSALKEGWTAHALKRSELSSRLSDRCWPIG